MQGFGPRCHPSLLSWKMFSRNLSAKDTEGGAGGEGWGWGAVLHFPWDSKLWAYPLCRCLMPPLHDIQAQPSFASLRPRPPNLGLLAFEGTMPRPGSASGRIWSRSGNHPSSGSSPEIGVGEVLPACQLWVGVCEAPGATGLLLKSLAQLSDSTLALEEGRPGSHAGLPGRKPVVPRWPQDKAGYIAGKGGVWVQSQMEGKKGVQDRKAPGTGPMGAPKQAMTRAGVQWVVRPSALSQGLSPRAPQSPALCLGHSPGGAILNSEEGA